ncbi:MAG: hypothetical protein ACFFDI_24500, partial [Promethearchaeota archaeon]
MAKWTSLIGEFEIQKNQIRFKGGTTKFEGKDAPNLGNYISSERFSGGTISAKIKFTKISKYSACEIILFRDPQTGGFITAGIGSSQMYVIRYFTDRWINLNATGDRVNMKAGIEYETKVSVLGSWVRLNIDGVDIINANLPISPPQSNVGIWCMDINDIIITDFKVDAQLPSCFVIMQFTTPYNELYQDVIQPVCEKLNVDCKRADESYTSELILADISHQIRESKFIIADISPKNPNVFYELGYAHALTKPTILIADKETELPFDISPFRTLFYENSIRGKKHIEDGLIK